MKKTGTRWGVVNILDEDDGICSIGDFETEMAAIVDYCEWEAYGIFMHARDQRELNKEQIAVWKNFQSNGLRSVQFTITYKVPDA